MPCFRYAVLNFYFSLAANQKKNKPLTLHLSTWYQGFIYEKSNTKGNFDERWCSQKSYPLKVICDKGNIDSKVLKSRVYVGYREIPTTFLGNICHAMDRCSTQQNEGFQISSIITISMNPNNVVRKRDKFGMEIEGSSYIMYLFENSTVGVWRNNAMNPHSPS